MNRITPLNYRIRIEPDLSDFTFSGHLSVRLNAPEPTDTITLNILELTVQRCRVKADRFLVCDHETDTAQETLRIKLPEATRGTVEIDIDYRGVINDQMAGFYRSGYTVAGESRFIAVTQFQESDARRAFPCMDTPAAKATFDIEIVVDGHLTAISNCDIAGEKTLEGGKKHVTFQRTPKMSTYLVFFGIGEFEISEDDTDNRVRSVTLPNTKEYSRFGRDFGRKALEYCEAYYGIPYPLSKLDLIAIPDFAFGAMENWGAITFRENLLLHYPDITSRLGESRICEVIAHEIAHQWFGNLVTPSDWTYLWLNESFATYFGYGVVDYYHPQWQTWDHFLNGQTSEALHRDALQDTCPIEIPGGEHVVINTSTAPIIYSKGGSILRQIEGFIGGAAFQKGLRHYLKEHEYGCAESRHLWKALEAASDKPVTAMMKSWVEQPGHPVVNVRREGDALVLEQQRFTYLSKAYDQHWMIPLIVSIFDKDGNERQQQSTLFDGKRTRIDLGGSAYAYKVNRRQIGFYRVCYEDTENLQRLGKLVGEKKLSAEDRWGLAHDLFSLVQSGGLSMDDYLAFLENYMHEDAYLPIASIADSLFHAHLVMADEMKDKVATFGQRLTESVLSNIGFEPMMGEPHATAILRDQILWHAVVYGSRKAVQFAGERFADLIEGKPIHPDIKKSILQAGAYDGDGATFDWLTHQIEQTESEHDRMNMLLSMGCFRDLSLIHRAQDYLLKEVPDRNRFVPIASLCRNPHAVPVMWDWFVLELDELEKSHPLLFERVIASIVPVCGMVKAEEVKTFFDTYVRRNPKTADVVTLSLEKLEIHRRMRGRNGGDL